MPFFPQKQTKQDEQRDCYPDGTFQEEILQMKAS
jgi:hypothetical protein